LVSEVLLLKGEAEKTEDIFASETRTLAFKGKEGGASASGGYHVYCYLKRTFGTAEGESP